MITLHYHPGDASQAPHIVLQELGVPYELALVDKEGGAHKSAAYLKLNPNGLIPVLVDGDLVLYEAAAICMHLADTHAADMSPAAQLAPPLGSAARAHYLKWQVWLTNTLQASLIEYFYPERLVDAGNVSGVAQVKAHARAKVDGQLKLLDAQLASHGKAWLLGDAYSTADAYTLMLCRWTRGFTSKPARDYPHIGPFLQRMLARPAVQRAFAAEPGLTTPWV